MTVKTKNTPEKHVEALAKKLFSLVGIDVTLTSQYHESVDQDSPDAVDINIESGDNTGLLIGKRGETLSAIQSFLSVATSQALDKWVRVNVNVGDWRERQEDYLSNLADQSAHRAKETGEPQPLYNLTPLQRRVVHMALSDNEDIETESQGEGDERHLVVKLKSK